MMKLLGAEYFKNTIYVNFDADEKIGVFFQTDIHADTIIRILEKYYHLPLIPDETLIIFDEIQMCERALASLKYFAEEAPEFYVIAAGSLLGAALTGRDTPFRWGKYRCSQCIRWILRSISGRREKRCLRIP